MFSYTMCAGSRIFRMELSVACVGTAQYNVYVTMYLPLKHSLSGLLDRYEQ